MNGGITEEWKIGIKDIFISKASIGSGDEPLVICIDFWILQNVRKSSEGLRCRTLELLSRHQPGVAPKMGAPYINK